MASWKGFWDGLGTVLAKAAIWAASNPQVVTEIAQAAEKGEK